MDELGEPNTREESPQTKLQFVAISESAADVIAAWTYAAPYTLYNHAPDQRAATVRALLDASLRFSAITDEMGDLAGFCCLGADAQVIGGSYELPAIDIGMGMRPELTGKGHGRFVVESVIKYALGCHPDARLRVTIAEFNARAQRVWSAAGFREESQFARASDGLGFVVLTRSPA